MPASGSNSPGPCRADVGFVSVYSCSDGIVDWRACLDPAADERVEIDASHCGMSLSAAAWRAVATSSRASAAPRRAAARLRPRGSRACRGRPRRAPGGRRAWGLRSRLVSEPFGPLVTVDWLGSHLGEPDLVVVDCRFTLDDPRRVSAAGSRATSRALRFSTSTATCRRAARRRRHGRPPSAAGCPRFEASARRAGIDEGCAWSPTTRRARAAPPGSGGCCATSATTPWPCSTAACAAWRAASGALRAGTEQPGAADSPRAPATATPSRPRSCKPRRRGCSTRAPASASGASRAPRPGGRPHPRGAQRPLRRARARRPLSSPRRAARAARRNAVRGLLRLGRHRLHAAARRRGRGHRGALYPGSWSEWSRRGPPVATADG